MSSPVRIGAIDDDRMLLQGLAAWLEPLEDVLLVRMASTVAEYLQDQADVDVILLDLNLRDGSNPGRNVQELLETGAAILVVSTIPDQEHVLATIEAGASGYITKDNDLPNLVDFIRSAAKGELAVSPELAFLLSTDARPQRPRLSAQESTVLRIYASGATLAATARQAGVAYGTAREYLERVKRKYTDAGWPTRTKLELRERLWEEDL
ncbi:DNA-binding NarL/FixJ family response regulator [Paenarthrobacter nicotinovorans]|uniref:response regulator n=1 Tax=Micrococcaceae TaxID=1268 RepID=UPI0008769950|nr:MULTISPECIES: response regulator transcription factor [Micrococcaceae]MDR6438806.1 DNA-binding NarL/FixJ family response regulator [Paenarthrobacter nicotinovorans]SCZ56248.1 DNA-binding response regulator, NarL/FixJ family, contains REC and HTH domains [Arthrobacter sp. UNCCL28]